jgi:hypothetical protein
VIKDGRRRFFSISVKFDQWMRRPHPVFRFLGNLLDVFRY